MPRNSCIEPAVRNKFRRKLLRWYKANRRDLPWRASRDPYNIWVSEVMLQQTRVAAVLDHYAAFLQKFPDIAALAQARESEVLAAWSGLGYYSSSSRSNGAPGHRPIYRQRYRKHCV
jgi:adenine-specific DNA glycosylase